MKDKSDEGTPPFKGHFDWFLLNRALMYLPLNKGHLHSRDIFTDSFCIGTLMYLPLNKGHLYFGNIFTDSFCIGTLMYLPLNKGHLYFGNIFTDSFWV